MTGDAIKPKRKIAPMFSVRDKWLSLLKEHGPLSSLQLTRMMGSKPSGKAWENLIKEGCIRSRQDLNPLFGEGGIRPIVAVFEYVKDPKKQPGKAAPETIEKARKLLAAAGWTLIPPGVA